MDLADPRRLYPTAARPAAGGRPTSPLGKTNSAGQAHPRPSPPRLPAHPSQGQLPCPSAETHPPRPRTTPRQKEHPTHSTPRRAHTPQNSGGETANEEVDHPTTTPHRLKIKLGEQVEQPAPGGLTQELVQVPDLQLGHDIVLSPKSPSSRRRSARGTAFAAVSAYMEISGNFRCSGWGLVMWISLLRRAVQLLRACCYLSSTE
jgi:hypothetical protein